MSNREDMKEIWKEIPSFKSYQVSNLGNVRRADKSILKMSFSQEGYRKVGLKKGNAWFYRAVQGLVLEAFVGPRPLKHDACHNNGVHGDNRLENLRWDTRKSNCADTIKHGKTAKGEKSAQRKLNDAAVIDMRERFAQGEHWSVLINKYKISRSHFYFLMRRDRWNHI